VLKRFTLKYVLFSMILDAVGVTSAFMLATHLRYVLPYGQTLAGAMGSVPPAFYFIAIAVWLTVAFAVSLYDPRKSYKIVDEFQALSVAVGLYWLGVAGVLYFTFRQTSRMLVVYAMASSWVLVAIWRVAMRVYFRIHNGRGAGIVRDCVLIIGAGEVGQRVAHMLHDYAWTGLEVVGYLDDDSEKLGTGPLILGDLDDVCQVVTEYAVDDVILALPPRAHERLNQVVSMLHELPVHVRIVPDYFSLALYRATADDFGGVPMISLRDPALNDYQRLVKRVFDLVVGGIFTLLMFPVIGAVALAIKLDSPGPVLFRQKRVGENGCLFEMLKFRSMVVGAEEMQVQVNGTDEDGNTIHKKRDDPRVTRVGRFIRRWSVDELPQLFNVLKGDISLVGPRPELPWLVDKYELWQRKRFAVPQGITGWWQVNGRSDKMMHLHTDEDLFYVQNYSLWLDIYILLKTPWVVVRGRGAY
jgi:exopolysaccharide biosynthesis polyprenyl glycosylphosphotransferase